MSNDNPYAVAFYELAKILDIGAQPETPAHVWETQMLPKVKALVEAAEARSADAASIDRHLLQWDIKRNDGVYVEGPLARSKSVYMFGGWEGGYRGSLLLSDDEASFIKERLTHAMPLHDANEAFRAAADRSAASVKPSPGNETITGETARRERCELPPPPSNLHEEAIRSAQETVDKIRACFAGLDKIPAKLKAAEPSGELAWESVELGKHVGKTDRGTYTIDSVNPGYNLYVPGCDGRYRHFGSFTEAAYSAQYDYDVRLSAASDIVALKPKLKASDEVRAYLSKVEGHVEATNFEKSALWARYHGEMKWQWAENRRGYGATVGYVGDHAVCISILVDIVQGRPILFYFPTSVVVDYRMIESWLMANLSEAAAGNKSDAQNFVHLFAGAG